MRTSEKLLRGMALFVVALMPWGLAGAANNQNDGNDPEPGSGIGHKFNPTFVCIVGPNDTLDDVFDCLADNLVHPPPLPCGLSGPTVPDPIDDGQQHPTDIMQNPPGDDDCSIPQAPTGYRVDRLIPSPPSYGLSIFRDSGDEPDRLWFWEDDPNIQMTYVEVNKPGLVGRIGEFVESPSRQGGIVTVTVNGFPVEVNTSGFRKPTDLTRELRTQLQNASFDVTMMDGGIVILADRLTGASITSVRFQSEDPAIISSDLAVVPFEELLKVKLLGLDSR